MKIFYIGDLHFGHNNIIKYDDRPFLNVQEMDMSLINNWNSVVTDEDKVIILGDFTMSGDVNYWCSLLGALNGTKCICVGNHDNRKCLHNPAVSKHFEWIKETMEIVDGNRRVIVGHYPNFWHKKSYDKNYLSLYAHVHTTVEWEDCKTTQKNLACRASQNPDKILPLGQVYNVGCMMPFMNYTPRTLDEIVKGYCNYYA